MIRHFLEKPPYELVESYEDFELRRYAPRVVAEVEVDGDMREASNRGFRRLAGYIFGGNEGGQKIKMTSPVDLRPDGERWSLTFTMPRQHDLQDLPVPNDGGVKLRQTDGQMFAAVAFRGTPPEADVQKRVDELKQAVAAQGLVVQGDYVYARYAPPSVPGFLKRNEVLLPVSSPMSAQNHEAPPALRAN